MHSFQRKKIIIILIAHPIRIPAPELSPYGVLLKMLLKILFTEMISNIYHINFADKHNY